MTGPVLYDRDGYVVRVTLNRPDRDNAIDDDMLLALDEALLKVEQDTDARVVVIRGAGSSFSVGEDLGAGAKVAEVLPAAGISSLQELVELHNRKTRRWQYLLNMPRPTIAQVHGACTGLAMNIAMLCDFVFAADDAVFGDRSLRTGILPSLPLWPFLVQLKVSKELLYLGRCITACEAENMGLINRAVPSDRLEAEVNRFVRGLLCSTADSLAWNKEALSAILEARGISNAWQVVQDKQLQASSFLKDKVEGLLDTCDAVGLDAAIESRDGDFIRAGFR